SAQIREILISESAWEEMTCLFAPSLSQLAGKAHRDNSFAPPWCRTFTMPPPVRHALITLTT
ncbi:hypothetical protein MGS53_20310, partial [Klebsiella pneumoniae]|nr:hypothetical protein [Klebsiella pneumoniae]